MGLKITTFFCLMFLVSCTVTKKVKDGETAFKYKQYIKATELLQKEYDKSRDPQVKARKAHLLAKSFDFLLDSGEALKWYDIADQLNYSSKSEEELAFALKRNERYSDAFVIFSDLYKKTKLQEYRREAAICKEAIDPSKVENSYMLKPMTFNTKYSEYGPVYYEQDFIIFTSDRQGSTGGNIYNWNDHEFSDFYIANKKGRNVQLFDGTLNSIHNEGTMCFNKTYDEIFFTRCFTENSRDQYCKLYYSMKPNDFWIDPEPLPFFGDQTNYGHPALIENDSVLIFSAKPEGSDNFDLYYSERIESGWTEAEIMPSSINTIGDEKFPTSDGDTLYFASNGHAGYGGLDIFKTYLDNNGRWSKPTNMGLPINSGADDFSFVTDPNFTAGSSIEEQGFFSSSRNTGTFDDIFFFMKYVPDEPLDTIAEDPIVEDEDEDIKIYLAARVVEIIYQDNDPNANVISKKPLPGARLEINSSRGADEQTSDRSGRILKEVQPDNYFIKVSKSNYLANEIRISIDTEDIISDTTINVEIPLDKIYYNKEIVLDDIYYDYDKWDIRDDAKPALDSLLSLLELNTDVKIQLGSHTDCRGELDYNSELSQKRAQSAVDYLVNKGIQESRLSARGFGELKPAVECDCDDCTEDEHQINRRTTFSIVR